jgi:hypothetical protein
MVPQTIIVSLIVFLTFMPGSELCERHDQKKRGTEDVCYGGGQIRVYIMNVSGQGRVNIFQGYGSEPRTDKPISSKPNLENKEFKVEKQFIRVANFQSKSSSHRKIKAAEKTNSPRNSSVICQKP